MKRHGQGIAIIGRAGILSGTGGDDVSHIPGLGQKIIRIAHAEQDKPGKVAREVLELLG